MQNKPKLKILDGELVQVGKRLWATKTDEKDTYLVKARCPHCRTLTEVQRILIIPQNPVFETKCELCNFRTGWNLKDALTTFLKVN